MLRRNVLIFQTGGLGDFILTWPFAVALGRIYAQSRIVYVTYAQKGELARRVLRLEATDIEAGWHGLFAEGGDLPTTAMSLLQSAHAMYTFLPVDSVWKQNVQRLNPSAKLVEINSKLSADYPGHLTEKILESLKDHAPERTATEQILRSIASRGIGYHAAGGGGIVIHPSSGSREKCWPLASYAELGNRLKNNGLPVRFVIGEVERERWGENETQLLKSAAEVRVCETCLDLLNEIETADCFIGNDSGPSHLAGIIAIRTFALFGPTSPIQWKPLGPAVKVISEQALSELGVDQVLAQVIDQK